MTRRWLVAAGVSGALAVALGAFGAHGLEAALAVAEDGAKRIGWWETAAHYHLIHSVALIGVAWARSTTTGRAPTVAGGAFVLGVVLFSGSLYAMTLTDVRALGMVTPLGGTAFIVGWVSLALAGGRVGRQGGASPTHSPRGDE
ncbi:MAG: DUF423 domain-containing protein [Deltaproteobacteria bacterium]|nr:MAG: DUF423 domain-containing protein [Deltaproteobacteria bacterium]